jgi:GPI ethanolamine phosphate transferase 1
MQGSVLAIYFLFSNHVFFYLEVLIADASFLDHWSFDQFQGLLNRSFNDVKLRQLLLQDKLVIFLHLLGCDTNGHAHRPYSDIYLNNVKVVDQIAESVYNLMESYFNDNQTAYVFTADHGMSDKGKILTNGFIDKLQCP